MVRAIYKVPNGKLVKIALEMEENRVKNLKIFGDFFVYPECRIEELEIVITGTALNEEALGEKIERFFADNKTELFGVDIPSLVHVILEAAHSGAGTDAGGKASDS